jgi:hypothetical protein
VKTGIRLFVTTLQATGFTYNPTASLGRGISVTSTRVTGITYNPNIRVPFTINPSLVTARTYGTTLSLGYTLFVGTSSATARTYNPTSGSLPEDFGGSTSVILDSYPSLRKGMIDVSSSNVAVVIAGQIGLAGGDMLIYLGNGQWKIR